MDCLPAAALHHDHEKAKRRRTMIVCAGTTAKGGKMEGPCEHSDKSSGRWTGTGLGRERGSRGCESNGREKAKKIKESYAEAKKLLLLLADGRRSPSLNGGDPAQPTHLAPSAAWGSRFFFGCCFCFPRHFCCIALHWMECAIATPNHPLTQEAAAAEGVGLFLLNKPLCFICKDRDLLG